MLQLTIAAPFAQLMRERSELDELDGVLTLLADHGQQAEFDVGVRTRGNFRRQKSICRFAPLRINFRKSQLEGTLFAGQDKLKLVTHCNGGSARYQQGVLREYLAYRIFNMLTDFSYRVRLLRISYVSTDGGADATSYAFFIEDDERLARRLELEQLKVPSIALGSLQPEYTNLTSVFQYLIGNLDFSPIRGAEGEDCCHNHALFSDPQGVYRAIPYDFDLSGMVDAEYHAPNERLGQISTRQRIYRGRCANNDRLPATLQLFLDRRTAIESVIADQAELDKGTRRSLDAYISSFYKKIDSARAAEQLAKECM
ncbi:MAG: CotH kinase family protein [Gammaproteobacteria bacterium]|nr:CotH kinase family protein [Gammaproteobacteria bacterium]MDH5305147.1 CotH kinase family protein [Gammaproteobacteria bacterium]MDH5323087.1 CotH kinase family protein [Gammaproteobacteria bacterium]